LETAPTEQKAKKANSKLS